MYIDIFKPAVTREEDRSIEELVYTSVKRDENINRPFAISTVLESYRTSNMIKIFGITLKEALRMPEEEFSLIIDLCSKINKDEYDSMKGVINATGGDSD